MVPTGPIALAIEVATILEEVGIDYVLGGSLASSVVGEPRSTLDIDMAVRMDEGGSPHPARSHA
ncbi:hypothetical protein B7486_57535, partial [cyanobacterium TDX16]